MTQQTWQAGVTCHLWQLASEKVAVQQPTYIQVYVYMHVCEYVSMLLLATALQVVFK